MAEVLKEVNWSDWVGQPLDTVKKVTKKKDEELNSFDISNQKKCFIIKVKNKYEDYYPQEIGGALFSYIRKFKDIKKIDFYVDSLDFDKEKTAKFFSEFIFGFSLKSYVFNKYKTLDKNKINKKIITIIKNVIII